MRRNWLWGLVLLFVGILLLLDNLGYLAFLGVSIWQLIWPIVLIGLGIWFLVGHRFAADTETRELMIAREATEEAELHLNYGAGEVFVEASESGSELLKGTFEGGVEHRVDRRGGKTAIWLNGSQPTFIWPGNWRSDMQRRWRIQLSVGLPLDLQVKAGASDCHLNLRELQVKHLSIDAGASSLDVTLPANAGFTEVRGSSGAASLVVRVPEGVAARIRTSGGLSSIRVDRSRFPRHAGSFESPGYETARNRVDIRLGMGVGSIEIR
jgi:hypothetical protein